MRQFLWTDIRKKKYSNIKLHENPSSGGPVVPCGGTKEQTTQLIIAFRNFADKPKNRIATNSVMCAVQQLRLTGQISKDGMSVGHGMCLKILNMS